MTVNISSQILYKYLIDQNENNDSFSFSHVYVAQNEHILRKGDVCKYIYFITKGALEVCTSNDLSIKLTKTILPENTWVSDFMSFASGYPSQENIKTIEDSELFVIDRHSLEIAMERNPMLPVYYNQILEEYYNKVFS